MKSKTEAKDVRPDAKVNGSKPPNVLTANYVKTGSYRTYYVDGLFGGVTPNLKIYIELFLQRQATPQIIEYEVTPEGTLGKEVKRVGKQGIIREIEAGLVMDLQTAIIFRDWLDGRIKELTEIAKKEQMKKGK